MKITYTREQLMEIKLLPLSNVEIKLPAIKFLTFANNPVEYNNKSGKRRNHRNKRNHQPVEKIKPTKLSEELKVKAKGIFNKITRSNYNKLSNEFGLEIQKLEESQKLELYEFISDKVIFEYNFIELYIDLVKDNLKKNEISKFYSGFKKFVEKQQQDQELSSKKEKNIGRFIGLSFIKKLIDSFDIYDYIELFDSHAKVSGIIEIALTLRSSRDKTIKSLIKEINSRLNTVLISLMNGKETRIPKEIRTQEKFKIMDYFDKISKKIPQQTQRFEQPKKTNVSADPKKMLNSFREFLSLCKKVESSQGITWEISSAYIELEYYLKDYNISEFVYTVAGNVIEETSDNISCLKELIKKLENKRLLSKDQKKEVKERFDIAELSLDIPKIDTIINFLFD